jgi:hypothetical protein
MKKWVILLATSALLIGCDQANQGGTGTETDTTTGQSPSTPVTPSEPSTTITNQPSTNQVPATPPGSQAPATPPATPPSTSP